MQLGSRIPPVKPPPVVLFEAMSRDIASSRLRVPEQKPYPLRSQTLYRHGAERSPGSRIEVFCFFGVRLFPGDERTRGDSRPTNVARQDNYPAESASPAGVATQKTAAKRNTGASVRWCTDNRREFLCSTALRVGGQPSPFAAGCPSGWTLVNRPWRLPTKAFLHLRVFVSRFPWTVLLLLAQRLPHLSRFFASKRRWGISEGHYRVLLCIYKRYEMKCDHSFNEFTSTS